MAPVWLDYLGTFSTALAAVLALFAIDESRRQGNENARMILADRQAQYGLGVLREINSVLSQDRPFASLHSELRGLILVCPAGLPLLRQTLGFTNLPPGTFEYWRAAIAATDEFSAPGDPVGERIRPQMAQEVREAIAVYLKELSVDPKYQPGVALSLWNRLVRYASRNRRVRE